MATKDSKFVDEYVKRSIKLGKAVEGQAAEVARKMAELHEEILLKVKEEYPKLTGRTITKLNSEIVKEIVERFEGSVLPAIDEVAKRIAEREAAWVVESLRIYGEIESIKVVNSETIAKAASKKTYQGHTFNFWFKKAGSTSHKRIVGMLESAYVNGATTEETVTQIQAVLNKSKHDIRTLTRSYLNHTSVESRYRQLESNDDLIEGYYWVSTLDNRTTPMICGIRDGLEYDKNYKPVDHATPWGAGPGRIHFNCRSNYIPKPKGAGDLRKYIKRPAVNPGKAYEKGDKTTRTGRVRKPTKYNRDKDIYKVSQVKGGTTYEDWLRTKKTSYVADILGNKELVEDFKAGRINLLDVAKQGKLSDINNL